MRKVPVAVAAIAAACSFGAPAAHAEGANVGLTGFSLAYATVDTATLGGVCKYVRDAVGVGGSGITYHIVGAGTAGGAYRGIPVVATGVRCRLKLPTVTVTSGPEYLPGVASETNIDYTTNDASGGPICTTVYGVLRQTPPGETDNLINTPERCV